jgi:hypothetical protein
MSTRVPSDFQPRFVEWLDQRSRVARELRQREQAITADLGGPDALTYAKRSLIRHALWIELILEERQAAWTEGAKVELGSLLQATNTLQGVWKTLGIERKARPVGDLKDYIREAE